MTPDDIYAFFMEHWAGTEAELAIALEEFYNDIRDSVTLALKTGDSIEETLDDYFNSVIVPFLSQQGMYGTGPAGDADDNTPMEL